MVRTLFGKIVVSFTRLAVANLTLALTAGVAAAPAVAFWPSDMAAQAVPPAPLGAPKFMWGVTLAGYQNDGVHPAMDWDDLEKEGKLPERSGKGPDFRGHIEADLDRAKSLGLNAFRTSIEWARIEPEEGRIDQAEVAYTHHLLRSIRQRGMTPVITLHHFATPKWAMKGGERPGWESPEIVEHFGRYVAFVAKEFGHEIDWYITFNEPSTLIGGGYLLGWTAPHQTGPVSTARAAANLIAAHVEAYQRIHQFDRRAMVSVSEYNSLVPVAGSGVYFMPTQWLGFFLDKDRRWDGRKRVRYLDYIALHYYGAVDISAASAFPVQPWRWGVRPEHLSRIVKDYYNTFQLPILIAENGFATRNNEARPDGWTRESYLVAHVKELQHLRASGVPLLGYMYWTLTDNFEWGSYDPRFGLWSVDVRSGDLTRHETPAAQVYREIVANDGVPATLEARFPPPVPTTAAMR